MRWTEPFDFYCERTGSGFGLEPLNMATALIFIGVAIWAWKLPSVRLPAAALAAVGVGAFLFHATGHFWALQLDIVANWMFHASLGWAIAAIFLGQNAPRAIMFGLTLAIGMHFAAPVVGPWLPGIAGIAGYLMLLAILGVVGASDGGVRLAMVLLGLGLPFRLLDIPLCDAWAFGHLGTHMIWHLFNGAAMAALLLALSRRSTA